MMPELEQLLSVMDELCQEHRKLLDACRRQQQSLIRNDTVASELAVAEMDGCVKQVAALEDKRQSIAARMADHWKISQEQFTVSTLMERIDTKLRDRLSAITSELQDALYELRMVNQVNDGLVQNALLYVRKMLYIVASTLEEERYGSSSKAGVGGRLFSAEA